VYEPLSVPKLQTEVRRIDLAMQEMSERTTKATMTEQRLSREAHRMRWEGDVRAATQADDAAKKFGELSKVKSNARWQRRQARYTVEKKQFVKELAEKTEPERLIDAEHYLSGYERLFTSGRNTPNWRDVVAVHEARLDALVDAGALVRGKGHGKYVGMDKYTCPKCASLTEAQRKSVRCSGKTVKRGFLCALLFGTTDTPDDVVRKYLHEQSVSRGPMRPSDRVYWRQKLADAQGKSRITDHELDEAVRRYSQKNSGAACRISKRSLDKRGFFCSLFFGDSPEEVIKKYRREMNSSSRPMSPADRVYWEQKWADAAVSAGQKRSAHVSPGEFEAAVRKASGSAW
jgi:hypothetical protein